VNKQRPPCMWGMDSHIHLRVKETRSRLHNSDGLVVDGNVVEAVLVILQHSHELQTQILGVQVGGEGIRDGLLRTSRDLDRVLLRSEVANDARLSRLLQRERTANNRHAYGGGFTVGDGQAGFGGMAVDELDAEDFRLREGDGDLDVQIGSLGLLCDLFNLQCANVSLLMSCLVGTWGLTSMAAKALRAPSESSSREGSFHATMVNATEGRRDGCREERCEREMERALG
jgi:hypothetical protein